MRLVPIYQTPNTSKKHPQHKIYDVAKDVGMDIAQLKVDMQSKELQILLGGNTQAAEMLGVSGTPAFIVGDQIFKGAIPRDQME